MPFRYFFTIAAIAALGLTGCSNEPAPGDLPRVKLFEGSDAFFAAHPQPSTHRQVVFVGIDGASWQFIDPLIADGTLPNFARIKREGAFGKLRSVPVHYSPPAWATMHSGYLPHQTGIYSFGKWHSETQEFLSVNSLDMEVPSVWDVASHGGRRVAVINVPMTFPAHPVNGVVVSGLMTPIEGTEMTGAYNSTAEVADRVPVNASIESYSPVLKFGIDDRYNSFRWSVYDTRNDFKSDYDKVSVTVFSKVNGEEATGTYMFDVGDFSPWMKIIAERDGDVVDAYWKFAVTRNANGGLGLGTGPVFFDMPDGYAYPDSMNEVFAREFGFYLPTKFLPADMVPHMAADAGVNADFLYDFDDWDLYLYVFTQSDNIHHLAGFDQPAVEVYKAIDAFLGRLMVRMPPDGVLFVGSDHGFGHYRYGIDLNSYLADLGLLQWRGPKQVDFDNSMLFHNMWHLYINRELVTREEIAARGLPIRADVDPVEGFMEYLMTTVSQFSGANGETIELEFVPIEAGVGGKPDMYVTGTYGEYFVDFWNMVDPKGRALREMSGSEEWKHIRDGIIMAWGEGVPAASDIGTTDIQNVAPTMLYALGLPIAADMDGLVETKLFTHDFLREQSLFLVPDFALIVPDKSMVQQDREDLEKKLRSLGYIR